MQTMARLLRLVWRGEVPAGILRDYLMEESSREERFGRFLDRLWKRYCQHPYRFQIAGVRFNLALDAYPRNEEWIPF